MKPRSSLAKIESRLSALGIDSVEINTRCLLKIPAARSDGYKSVLAALDKHAAAAPGDPQVHALRGKVLGILNRQADAVSALQQSVALDDRQTRNWSWLGEAYLMQARLGEARSACDQALALDARNPWAYFFRAAAVSVDDLAAAQADLRLASRHTGKTAAQGAAEAFSCLLEAGNQHFGRARLSLKRLSRRKLSPAWFKTLSTAVLDLEKATCSPLPQSEWVRAVSLAPAIELLKAGKIPKALSLLRKEALGLAAVQPQDIDLYVDRFCPNLLALDFTSAAGIGEKILDLSNLYHHLHRLTRPFFDKEFDFLSVSDLYTKQAEDALNDFVRSFPASPWGYYWRDVFRDMVGLDRRDPQDRIRIEGFSSKRYGWMRTHTGIDRLFKEDFDGAIKQFKIAVRASKPGDWTAQCLIGEALMCRGDTTASIAAFRAAQTLAPPRDLGGVLAWKGGVLLWSGAYARALKASEAAVGLGATFAHCWLGGSLVKLGLFKKAVDPLLKAIESTPHDAEARTWLAEAYYHLGRFKEALREADIAVDRYERYCSYHLFAVRGLTRLQLGDVDGMRRDFNMMNPRALAVVSTALTLGLESDEGKRKAMEGILQQSRGVRRGSYENRIWLGRL